MVQKEIIIIYDLVMVSQNLANGLKMREGSWLNASIENLFD